MQRQLPQVVKGFAPPRSDQAVSEATGRGWQLWFTVLDEWGAATRSHRDIARHLERELGVVHWWSQTITLAYEQARGLRAPGQNSAGWVVSASKTIAVPVEHLFSAFELDSLRSRWATEGQLRLRTAIASRSARFDWENGATRVNVSFLDRGPARSTVAISHERLPHAEGAEQLRVWWRERLDALKHQLEDGEER